MAASLITVSGTSGQVMIKYIDSGKDGKIIADFGSSVYIPDTSTNVTYTTISGDATASSGVITITELPSKCYIFSWETIGNLDSSILAYFFDKVILGTEEISISDVGFNEQEYENLAIAINELGDDRIRFVAGKISDSGRGSKDFSIIIQILSTELPELRVRNDSQEYYFYLKGEYSVDCLPSGFIEFSDCLQGTTTSTTTTSSTTTTTTGAA